MEKFEEIIYPTREEKDQRIRLIVDRGVKPPCRLPCALLKVWQEVGIRGLFFGVGDCVFLAFLGAAFIWAGLFSACGYFDAGAFPDFGNNREEIYLVLFFASPFLYGLLHFLTIWKEMMTGTYELFMTCRISLRQMTVLRMLFFGGGSVVISIITNVGIWVLYADTCSLLRMMSLSFSALFLFAWLDLAVEWRWAAPVACFAAPAVWGILGIMMSVFGERASEVLIRVPTVVFAVIAVISAVLFARILKKYYFGAKEGVLAHAVS